MMNTVKMMEDKALTRVTGGDYGDSAVDYKAPLYYIGDRVEVYISIFHWHTKSGTVVEWGRYDRCPNEYLIEFEDGSRKWFYAERIQRKEPEKVPAGRIG